MPSSNLKSLRQLTEELTVRDATIKENERVLSMFFDLCLDILCIADLRSGYFIRANKAWSALGWTPEEITALPFLSFVHPEDRASTNVVIVELENGKQILKFSNRYHCKDGSYRTLVWSAIQDLESGLTYCSARVVD